MPTYTVVDDPDNPEPMQHPGITLVDHDGGPYNPATSIPDGTYVQPSATVDGARALLHLLKEGRESAAITVLGDSTSNDADEWFYGLQDWLGATFPAYTTLRRIWNGTNENYNRYIVGQIGTAGLAYVTTAASNWVSTPDSAGLSIVGDLAAVVAIRAADYTPASTQTLMAKFGGSGQRSWRWQLNAAGNLEYQWSTDGTTLFGPGGATSTVTLAAAISGLTDNTTDIALAVTHDVNNGSGGTDIKYWWAPFTAGTIGSWTQIGATCTIGATTSIFDSTNALEVGTRSTGSEIFLGRFYYAELRSGLDLTNSPIVASMNPSNWVAGTTFKDGEGNVWTLSGTATISGAPALMALNGSTSGQAIVYSTDVTRFAKQTPIEPMVTFINYSHNEGGTTAYAAAYAGLVDQLLTKYPYAEVCCVTQNPKKSPETAANIRAHATRNRQITQVAATKNTMLADAYRAFLNTGTPDTYVDAGGIHPTADGQALWLATVKALFTPWLTAA